MPARVAKQAIIQSPERMMLRPRPTISAVPSSAAAPVAAEAGGQHRQAAPRVERPAGGLGTLQPVAFAAHVAHLRVALDGADGQEVDHRLLAAPAGPAAARG